MMSQPNIVKNNNLLHQMEFGQPNFSSKNVTTQNTLKSKKLQKEYELEADAKQKAHNRKQSLEDIKNDVLKNIYQYILPFMIILLVLWGLCCLFNWQEIKNGVEWMLSTIITLFVGALIGKHI